MISTSTGNVGDRIECSGDFGTIKYVGSIDGYSGVWYGIDWDDKGRGKHDGIVKGVRYFTSRYVSSSNNSQCACCMHAEEVSPLIVIEGILSQLCSF